MWNYRVVRRKRTWLDSQGQRERVEYTYAIHEAHYDQSGHVGSITQEPIAVFGTDIEELRHTWVMMVEAFVKPILDYDQIPEPGYDRKEDQLACLLDKRRQESSGKWIPWEDVKKRLEEKWGPFDHERYEREQEVDRLAKESIHATQFVGVASLGDLIARIQSDYQEWVESEEQQR